LLIAPSHVGLLGVLGLTEPSGGIMVSIGVLRRLLLQRLLVLQRWHCLGLLGAP